MGGASKLSETAQVLFPSPALNPRVHCFILTQVALLVNLLNLAMCLTGLKPQEVEMYLKRCGPCMKG